ncbi:MAG: hypothetical protein HY535_01865 [Chloroflexi bacterium]|nr:hypothetical protein [Chloroflexota bacterium]
MKSTDTRATDTRVRIARLFGAVAILCGVIGLFVGLIEREWRLGVTGWFTGGTLLAVLALLLLADTYVEMRRHQS